jgi:hypothetical protein
MAEKRAARPVRPVGMHKLTLAPAISRWEREDLRR